MMTLDTLARIKMNPQAGEKAANTFMGLLKESPTLSSVQANAVLRSKTGKGIDSSRAAALKRAFDQFGFLTMEQIREKAKSLRPQRRKAKAPPDSQPVDLPDPPGIPSPIVQAWYALQKVCEKHGYQVLVRMTKEIELK